MFKIEEDLYKEGHRYIIGIDEAGRGPLAGDVVSAAVCIDLENPIEGIRDSKKLSALKRDELAKIIKDQALAYAIAGAPAEVIDRVNIKKATIKTMENALGSLLSKMEELGQKPTMVLVDSERIKSPIPSLSFDKGDEQTRAIGAASILAKVYRDRLCLDWDLAYPAYGFGQHKGYGTQAHREALVRYGPCPIHRRSFLKNLPKWRKNSYTLGGLGEKIAAEAMEEKGYQILERNYKLSIGEIDLIAEKDGLISFIEVKLRKNDKYGHGYEYVSQKQRENIKRVAQLYVQEQALEAYQFRFDIIEVYSEDGRIVIYEDAFN